MASCANMRIWVLIPSTQAKAAHGDGCLMLRAYWPVSLAGFVSSSQWETLFQKIKYRVTEEDTWGWLWSPGTQRYLCTGTHIHTKTKQEGGLYSCTDEQHTKPWGSILRKQKWVYLFLLYKNISFPPFQCCIETGFHPIAKTANTILSVSAFLVPELKYCHYV